MLCGFTKVAIFNITREYGKAIKCFNNVLMIDKDNEDAKAGKKDSLGKIYRA